MPNDSSEDELEDNKSNLDEDNASSSTSNIGSIVAKLVPSTEKSEKTATQVRNQDY